MMGKQVVFGAGTVGRGVAGRLAERGAEVLLVSRSGAGPAVPGATRMAADVSEPDVVAALAQGAEVLYNCLNPAYHRWATDWPPMAANLLAAAKSSQAVLVTMSNLYGYGPVAGPMTETNALRPAGRKAAVRVGMFNEALAAHRTGRIRMVEVRASDYIGPGAQGMFGDRLIPRLLAGRSVSVLGSLDQPHTWSYTGDVADLLVTVAADERAWGRAWHVPSNEPRTQRRVVEDLAAAAGVPTPRTTAIANPLLRVAGLFNPTIRELQETRYQFTDPFVMDSSDAQETFGMAATPWDEVLRATLAGYRSRRTPHPVHTA